MHSFLLLFTFFFFTHSIHAFQSVDIIQKQETASASVLQQSTTANNSNQHMVVIDNQGNKQQIDVVTNGVTEEHIDTTDISVDQFPITITPPSPDITSVNISASPTPSIVLPSQFGTNSISDWIISFINTLILRFTRLFEKSS